MTEHTMRLLRGEMCWWCMRAGRIARLPLDAVIGGNVVPEASAALQTAGFFDDEPCDTYAVTVMTTTTCNLGCSYCFQNTAPAAPGSFAPPRIPALHLTLARILKVERFIRHQMQVGGYEKLSVMLFGGEPLLNPRGCVELLTRTRSLGLVHAEMVSNGVHLTPELAAQLAAAGLAMVQITFDGARYSHDMVRLTRNGRGTYDKILANVKAAAENTGLLWNFRVNVSHRNRSGLDELVDELARAVPPERATLHFALIDDVGLGYHNDVGYTDEFALQLIALHRQAIQHGMFIPISPPLRDCVYCGQVGGATGAVINADGRLYSCWENTGRTDWCVGNVDEGYAEPETVHARWVACDFDVEPHAASEAQAREFFDTVHARLLDDLRVAGLLGARSQLPSAMPC
jgi:uncharacterized protein